MLDTHALVLADREGIIRVWSPGAEALFGYDAADAVGRTLDLIVPEAYRERHWAGFRSAIARARTNLDQPAANLPVLRRDGAMVRFAGRLVLLRDARGEAIGVLAIYSPNEGDTEGDPRLPNLA